MRFDSGLLVGIRGGPSLLESLDLAVEAFFEVSDGTNGQAELSGEGAGVGDAGTEVMEEGFKGALMAQESEEAGFALEEVGVGFAVEEGGAVSGEEGRETERGI